eukprot:m.85230 g.85230  ORF g.85230 m.85230 type:complete len:140 (-) comp13001_c0_seq6:1028-1447(-)
MDCLSPFRATCTRSSVDREESNIGRISGATSKPGIGFIKAPIHKASSSGCEVDGIVPTHTVNDDNSHKNTFDTNAFYNTVKLTHGAFPPSSPYKTKPLIFKSQHSVRLQYMVQIFYHINIQNNLYLEIFVDCISVCLYV